MRGYFKSILERNEVGNNQGEKKNSDKIINEGERDWWGRSHKEMGVILQGVMQGLKEYFRDMIEMSDTS